MRYLVDGVCFESQLAFEMYFSKQSPVVLDNVVYFPHLSGDSFTLANSSVSLSSYLPVCDGRFISAANTDFQVYLPIFIALMAVLTVIRVIKSVWVNTDKDDD